MLCMAGKWLKVLKKICFMQNIYIILLEFWLPSINLMLAVALLHNMVKLVYFSSYVLFLTF